MVFFDVPIIFDISSKVQKRFSEFNILIISIFLLDIFDKKTSLIGPLLQQNSL
ncbi:hypothetical protein IV70_GL000265 [Carnobacterium maltaromaticum DSM 20342]|nr:hypothetical protein IV70_GL000265 [Carnobacterium maltaromaticum DSM 20342]